MSPSGVRICRWMLALLVAAGSTGVGGAQQPSARPATRPDAPADSPVRAFVSQYCLACHNGEKKKGRLDLDAVSSERVGLHSKVWAKVVRKLRARKMPPEDEDEVPRPDERTYDAIVSLLEKSLPGATTESADPEPTDPEPTDREPADSGGTTRTFSSVRSFVDQT